MDSVTEEWRPVKGFEGKFEVSSMGRVKSLSREMMRNGKTRISKTRILKSTKNIAIGYCTASIAGRNRYVHHLVLEAFVGPRPERHEACHGNGDRSDNRLENLRWDTASSNQNDRAKHGTSNRGERCAASVLKSDQVLEIYHSKEPGVTLAKRYGVAQQTICGIRKGWKWTHLTKAGA